MVDLIGRTLLNRYRVEALLGRGGMAEVYKVWDTKRNTYLALKLLREELARDRVLLRRFQKEAFALGSLKHPNIVRFYGLETSFSLAFMLLDFVDGETLRQVILRHPRTGLSQPRILEIMRPVCSALDYAHNQGMVHCDIKPSNILLENGGRVLLTDFGIASMAHETATPMLGAGTAEYMAPEQILGKTISPQTDIYALGVLLYEMVTGGERPFRGDNANGPGTVNQKVRWEQINLAPPSPRKYNPGVSSAVEGIIFRCLAKDPRKRYPSAMEFANSLGSDTTLTGKDKTVRISRPWILPRLREEHDKEKPIRLKWQWLAIVSLGLMFVLLLNFFLPDFHDLFAIPSISYQEQLSNPGILKEMMGTSAGFEPSTVTPPKPRQTTYDVDSCMTVELEGDNRLIECVTGITILTDGRMRFQFSWMAQIGDNFQVIRHPENGNRNMYLMDDLGNRYDHGQVGGDADKEITLDNGETTYGWFLFPPANPRARSFVFHDDDNLVQAPPIQGLWP